MRSAELPSAAAVRALTITKLAELAGVDPAAVDARERFSRYGLDSLHLTRLAADLAAALGRPVSPALMFRHPSADALARHLSGGGAESEPRRVGAPQARDELSGEPVAVIGLACRFPNSPDPQAFWRLLREGGRALGEVSPDRWDAAKLHADDPGAPGKALTGRGGFLDGIDRFDPEFFDISPREAVQMDPQQRLMLELAWEALEDAGIAPKGLIGSATGVYAGAMWTDYAQGARSALELIGRHTLAGRDLSIIPARVSYTLGLEGPSLLVNTACSSSLVAVHLAVQALRDGECDLALAGGVSLMMAPETMVALSKLGALAPDGRTKAFDERADGYGRGEGGGMVVLKPLPLALAAGDPVYCVIRGTAVNNDGLSNGLTAPNPRAQEAVLRRAYARAGVDPTEVQYVEAHGTGTSLGDPIEAAALAAVLCARRPADRPLRLGSVKSNIGHLEPAAGIAGLIKVALSMRHGALPPAAGFERPNPHIRFAELGLEVQRSLACWPDDGHGRLLAGVSAFGFGGTNCHVVVEGTSPPAHVLALSAGDDRELAALAGTLAALPDTDRGNLSLRQLCTWAAARPGGRHRLALRVASHDDVTRGLSGFLAGRPVPGGAHGQVDGDRPKLAFLFGGQGSQWAGMAADLIGQEPEFRAAIHRCDREMRRHREWSLLRTLTSADPGWLADTARAQPAIFAIQVALARLWRSWGIEPDAVLGVSMGEVAAAHVAGALCLRDAVTIICRRSELAGELAGRGAMAVVELSSVDVLGEIDGYGDRLWLAGTAGPESTVLSGDSDALTAVLADLAARGVPTGRIQVDYASHSPWVDGILPRLADALAGLPARESRVPLYSSVTGGVVDGADLDAAHWVRTEREPWDLSAAAALLLEDGYELLVELDPHPVLARAIRQRLESGVDPAAIVPSLRRDESARSTLYEALGVLYARGAPVRWDRLYPRDVQIAQPPSLPAAGAAEPVRDQVLLVSARTPQALAASAESMADRLLEDGGELLPDVCFTAALRRSHHEHRLAVVGDSRRSLAASLQAAAGGRLVPGAARGEVRSPRPPELVFAFSGQGSQWPGMARELLAGERCFRDAVEAVDAAFQRLAGWSLRAEMEAPASASRLRRTSVSQPMLLAVQVALAELWASWGVRPAAVIGHSVGEVTAAYLAGVLDLTEAVRLVYERGRAMELESGRGRMAAVELAAAGDVLAGYGDRLAIAAVNDPESMVLSGEPAALADVVERLRGEQVHCRELPVDYAFHSPLMAPAAAALAGALGDVAARPARTPMYSTVSGAIVDGTELDAGHWARNVREPVRFADAVDRAIAAGHRTFLEVGPHPVLLGSIQRCLSARGVHGRAIGSLRRDEPPRRCLARSLGSLYTCGFPVDFGSVFDGGGRCVPLPGYPWQRDRFWLDAGSTVPAAPHAGRAPQEHGHPLLGPAVSVAVHPGTHVWQPAPARIEQTGLTGLRVWGEPVLPASALLEIALAAGAEADRADRSEDEPPGTPPALTDMTFDRMVPAAGDHGPALQVAVTTRAPGELALEVFMRDGASWLRHATGTIRPASASAPAAPAPAAQATPEQVQRRCRSWYSGAEHYAQLDSGGIGVGPALRGVQQRWLGDREVLGRVLLPGSLAGGPDAYHMHPTLLDSCLQLVAALCDAAAPGEGAHVVTAVERLEVHRRPGNRCWAHGSLRPRPAESEGPLADVRLIDDGGEVIAAIEGMRLRRLVAPSSAAEVDRPLAVRWRRADLEPQDPDRLPARSWLLLTDRHGTGDALATALREHGQRCVQVHAGERYERTAEDLYSADAADPDSLGAVLREAFGAGEPPAGVLSLWSLDGATTGPEDAGPHATGAGVLALAQALVRRGWRDPPRLWLVTRAAQPAGDGAGPPAVWQAPVWGVGRTIALEHPALSCTRVDLAAEPAPDEARQAVMEVLHGGAERDIALRPEGRLVARLVPVAAAAAAGTVDIHADGTYLVVAGRLAVAEALTGWLVAGGARHVAVIDADGSAGAACAARAAIAEPGAHVTTVAADVSDTAALAGALAGLEESMPPLRGIVHDQDTLEDRAILDDDPASFHRVVARRVACAWNLHALTDRRELDFLLLYASGASLLGSPGRAARAAVDAFADSLAHHCTHGGRRALSVNWGTIADGGGRGDATGRGTGTMTAEQSAETAGALLATGASQVAVLRFDVRHWVELHPSAAAQPMLSELYPERGGNAPGAARMRAALERAGTDERSTVLEEHVREQLASTVGQDPARVHRMAPFRSMGLESLMAVELRNRLESTLGLTIPVAVLFGHSTVAALTRHLLAELGLDGGDPGPTREEDGGVEPAGRAGAEDLAELSDTEAEAVLRSSIRAAEEALADG